MIDELFDRHVVAALAPSHEWCSAAEVLAAVHARAGRRRHGRRVFVALAMTVVAALLASGAVLAASLLRTVPVQIHVTHPRPGNNVAGPVISVKGGQPYVTTLAHAQAAAGYHVLTLPADVAALKSVTLLSPVTHLDGRPMSADEVLKPSINLVYLWHASMISVVEDPVKPSAALNLSVKDYGAPNTHTASVDGVNVVYSGTEANVIFIGFQTTQGLDVFMSSETGAAPDASRSVSAPRSLADWGTLINAMS